MCFLSQFEEFSGSSPSLLCGIASIVYRSWSVIGLVCSRRWEQLKIWIRSSPPMTHFSNTLCHNVFWTPRARYVQVYVYVGFVHDFNHPWECSERKARQHNRKTKQHNTTRTRQLFSKKKAASGGTWTTTVRLLKSHIQQPKQLNQNITNQINKLGTWCYFWMKNCSWMVKGVFTKLKWLLWATIFSLRYPISVRFDFTN